MRLFLFGDTFDGPMVAASFDLDWKPDVARRDEEGGIGREVNSTEPGEGLSAVWRRMGLLERSGRHRRFEGWANDSSRDFALPRLFFCELGILRFIPEFGGTCCANRSRRCSENGVTLLCFDYLKKASGF